MAWGTGRRSDLLCARSAAGLWGSAWAIAEGHRADTLDNIWPQCGPSDVALPQRFFKEKDTVENFLTMQVRAGRMDLIGAQRGIATDWTQFLDEARRACPEGRC